MTATDVTVWLAMLCVIFLHTNDSFVLLNKMSKNNTVELSKEGKVNTSSDHLYKTSPFKRMKEFNVTAFKENESLLILLGQNNTIIDDFDYDSLELENTTITEGNFTVIANLSNSLLYLSTNKSKPISSEESTIANSSLNGASNNLTGFDNSIDNIKLSSNVEIEKRKIKLAEILKRSNDINKRKDIMVIEYNFTASDNLTNELLNQSQLVHENITDLENSSSEKLISEEFEEFEGNATAKTSYYHLWLENFEKSGYDKNVRPYHGVKAVGVIVSIHVIRVHSISESTMDFGIDVYYRENWTDPRLAYNRSEFGGEFLNLPSSAVELIWFPDTYFSNAIRAETEIPGSVTHRSLIRLYPSGTVYYIRKISLTADCPMDISLYPFDKQGCKLVMNSYSYLKRDLYYKWRDGDPIDFQETVRLPEFQLLYHKSRYVDEVYYIGTYSTLHLCLVFKRSAGFCIMQVFFPATAVVMSSWVSLWMEEETQFNDVLGVILAIIFLAYAYNSVMPRVSYVKLLDLYLAACFLFVFLSLGKLVILKYCRKSYMLKRTINNERSTMSMFDQIVKAEAESSAIGSSDDEADSDNNKNKMLQNNNHHKPVSYDKAKKMLQRRVTMAKIELENNRRKLIAEKRFLRYLRIFHVVTQLALPIGFASFFVFVLIIYPNWPRPEPC